MTTVIMDPILSLPSTGSWAEVAVRSMVICGAMLVGMSVLLVWLIAAIRAGWKLRCRWIGKTLLCSTLFFLGAEKVLLSIDLMTPSANAWPPVSFLMTPIQTAFASGFVVWLLVEWCAHLGDE